MTIEELYRSLGGSYDATLIRLPSRAMILKFIRKFPGDPSFAQLTQALGTDDAAAFRAAHTLKGVAQNLGLVNLQCSAAALADHLREPHPLTDPALLVAVRHDYEAALAAIAALEA